MTSLISSDLHKVWFPSSCKYSYFRFFDFKIEMCDTATCLCLLSWKIKRGILVICTKSEHCPMRRQWLRMWCLIDPPCPAQPVDISIVIPWLSDSGDFSVRQTQRIIDRQSIRGHFINIEITEDISDLSECLHQTSWFMYLLCLFRVSLKTETEKKETDWERGMSLHLKLFPFCYDIASFQLIQSITCRLPALLMVSYRTKYEKCPCT